MSVTISPASRDSDVLAFDGRCTCGALRTGVVRATYDEARRDVLARDGEVCPECYCGMYAHAIVIDMPSVNMANRNAAHVLAALGVTPDDGEFYGSADADDMLGRVLLAQAIQPADDGTPSYEVGNLVECGRRAGYTDDRLAQVYEIAVWARTHGREVVWG